MKVGTGSGSEGGEAKADADSRYEYAKNRACCLSIWEGSKLQRRFRRPRVQLESMYNLAFCVYEAYVRWLPEALMIGKPIQSARPL